MSEPPPSTPSPSEPGPGAPSGGAPGGPPQYGQPQSGQPPYGPPQHGQPPHGQPQYGQPQYGPPQYGPPQYGQQYGPAYGQPPYGGPAGPQDPQYGPPGQQGAPAPGGVVVDLGPRSRRRPAPRFGISVAAVGAGLVLLGALVWAVGYLAEGFSVDVGDTGRSVSGDGRRFLGAALFLVAAVLGYVAMVLRRRGPVASAGAVLAALGVPFALAFLTLDLAGTFSGGSFPINLDAVYLGSIAIWLVTYFVVPGGKGRALFLAASAIFLASYVGLKIAGTDALRVGFSTFGGGSPGGSDDSSTGVGVAALLFGLAYYAVAALLDRRGRPGVAIAFVVAGFLPTVSGIGALAPDLDAAGTGVLLIVLGAVLSLYGAWAGRRATTWLWALGFGIGVVLVVGDVFQDGDSYVGAAVTLIVVGLVVVAAATAVSAAMKERPEDEAEQPVASGAPSGG